MPHSIFINKINIFILFHKRESSNNLPYSVLAGLGNGPQTSVSRRFELVQQETGTRYSLSDIARFPRKLSKRCRQVPDHEEGS